MPDVFLPVSDQAETLPFVLGRMPAGYRPVVVDNGSTDGSAEAGHPCTPARSTACRCCGFAAAWGCAFVTSAVLR